MSRKDPSGVGDILDALKQTTPLGRQLDEARIWEHWPEVAGELLMPHGRPRSIKDGQLTIEVDSAVWMHKFAYEKAALIDRINTFLGHALVDDVFLTLYEE